MRLSRKVSLRELRLTPVPAVPIYKTKGQSKPFQSAYSLAWKGFSH